MFNDFEALFNESEIGKDNLPKPNTKALQMRFCKVPTAQRNYQNIYI